MSTNFPTILSLRTIGGLAILSLACLAKPGLAAIVCQGSTLSGYDLKLTVEGDLSAKVEVFAPGGEVELKQDFPRIDEVWDGHMTGLITAPGLSFKYENHYGCIRNAVITTNVRGHGIGYIDTIAINTCRGGTTRDELCLRH